jgi:hypothetical protein
MHRRFLPAVSSALFLLPMALQAADSERIYSGKEGMREEWIAAAWGDGFEVLADDAEHGREAGQSAVKGSPKAGAVQKNYSGIALQIGYGKDQEANGIPLDEAAKTDGTVKFYLNEGKGPNGEEGRAARLQFNLGFVGSGGRKINGRFQPMAKYASGETTDGDPKTWEEITIPVSDVLLALSEEDKADIKALVAVYVQYTEEPSVEIFVTDCEFVPGK